MQELFVKKYWEEEAILFYLHFQDGKAVRQLEITNQGKVFLTLEHPLHHESMLYDQPFEELDLQESDCITKEEFNTIWNEG